MQQSVSLNNIRYVPAQQSDASTIDQQVKAQHEVANALIQLNQQAKVQNFSVRNDAGVYLVPVEKEAVWVNYIPQKTVVQDSLIRDRSFQFFTFPENTVVPDPEVFVVDGQFFRCAGEPGSPKNVDQYTYYFMENAVKKQIPNYRTLEVMLTERGLSLLDIRVLEPNQCNQIPSAVTTLPDKSSLWKPQYRDISNLEALAQLENSAQQAQEAAQQAAQNVSAQVQAVKAEADAAKAAAEAAQQQAAAAAAASQAAIADAQAREAEAAAKEAEFNAMLNSGT